MRNFVSMFVLAMAVSACEDSSPSLSVVDAGVVSSVVEEGTAVLTPTDFPTQVVESPTPSVTQPDAVGASGVVVGDEEQAPVR